MPFPVIRAAANVLCHVPGLVLHGSKPERETAKEGEHLEKQLRDSLRSYEQAVTYPPHQVFIGNLTPWALSELERPWYRHHQPNASRSGPLGEIISETEFLGLLKICDPFDQVQLDEAFAADVRAGLQSHRLITLAERESIRGIGMEQLRTEITTEQAVPLTLRDGRLVGCVRPGHKEDANLTGAVLLENLAAKASAVLATRWLLAGMAGVGPDQVDYLINTGEEAVGDRYQRGAGNLAKAVGETCQCQNATGADIAAFCCAPVHALVVAGALVQAGVYRNVVVLGGGSLAKLGMKFRGHLKQGIPIMEDVLASFAILVGPDDGESPHLRLDTVGRHTIAAGSSAEAIYDALVVRPLERRSLKLSDVDRYATELHNPEITETAGSGDVARTNYRIIASLAVRRGEIPLSQLQSFAEERGMPGFSPTQGHVPAAVPFIGHALAAIRSGEMQRSLLVAKGSLFLGMMTRMSDGMSVMIERNQGLKERSGALHSVSDRG